MLRNFFHSHFHTVLSPACRVCLLKQHTETRLQEQYVRLANGQKTIEITRTVDTLHDFKTWRRLAYPLLPLHLHPLSLYSSICQQLKVPCYRGVRKVHTDVFSLEERCVWGKLIHYFILFNSLMTSSVWIHSNFFLWSMLAILNKK